GGRRPALLDRLEELRGQLLDSCRPGQPASALLGTYSSLGLKPPPVPVARGLGLGFDLPIITADLPETAASDVLEPDLVFALTSYVWEPGVGAAIATDPVHLTERGPELLSEP